MRHGLINVEILGVIVGVVNLVGIQMVIQIVDLNKIVGMHVRPHKQLVNLLLKKDLTYISKMSYIVLNV
jgi:hypothetical protein